MKWGMRDMPSKTSWFNKEIIIQSFRSSGWVGIVYLLGLLFAIPLRILMDYTRSYDSYQSYTNLFSYQLEIQTFLMFGIPILLAIFLFRYLHVKNAADFMHSLPIKRSKLYNYYVCMGLLFLILPILLIALVLLIMHNIMNIDYYFTMTELFEWVLTTMIITVFVFLTTVFMGMLTGISVVQGAFSFVLLIFPLAISVLVAFNLSFLLKGFPDDYYIDKQFEKYSPITLVDRLANSKIGSIELFIYFLLSVLLYVLAMQIYKLRKIEMVSQAVGFPQLKPVFIYGITFGMMLFGGLYFGETQQHDFWIWFGYVAGSLIGYQIALMIVEKTWRVFTKLKGYMIYAAAMAVLFMLFQFDVTGYEKRVPEVQDIKGVYIGDGYYDYAGLEDSEFLRKKKIYSHPSNIESVHNLHKQLVKNSEAKGGMKQFFILYEMKDGSKVAREYKIPSKDKYASNLKPIYESMDYKQANYPILDVDASKVDHIKFGSPGFVSKNVSINDPKEITDILKAVKEDIQNQTFEDMIADRASLAYVSVSLTNNKVTQVDFNPSYTQLQKWLESKNKLQDAIITADDLRYAVVFKDKVIKRDPQSDEIDKKWMEEKIQNGEAIKVTDKGDLEESLRNYSNSDEGDYTVAFYYKNQSYAEAGVFKKSLIPDFVKQQLK
jgi:ABC-2 type transport system permease protein